MVRSFTKSSWLFRCAPINQGRRRVMDRKQKKDILLNITQLLDQKCAKCEYKYGKGSPSYCKENCSVFEELNNLSSKLINDEHPKKQEVIKKKHGFKTGRWSNEDEFYLIHHAGLFSYEHLAKKLNRYPKDVYNKIWRLKVAKKISI
jgi:hypothetical protein